jgi:iron complex outermembrane receptor protein
MRRFILVQLMLIIASGAFAQHRSLADTILLHEVVTYAPLKKYQAGAKIESISPDQLQISQVGGIDQMLMRFTPIYLKSNAGGLSTIRLRGTSANHTSVNFGGINLNSLTLGHSDMSSIPSYLFDKVDLQYGSSSVINGSGSIGGSLALGLQNSWTDGFKLSSNVSLGSFGEQFYGAKIFVGNGRFEAVSRLYYFDKKNDFPFKNQYTGDVENREPVDDIQHGASIKNMGLLQELNFRFGNEEFIKSAVWLEQDWHQIQPNMQTNIHYTGTEELLNNYIRFWSEYMNNKHDLKYRGGLGYVHDMQIYDKDDLQKIGTDRLISELEVNQDLVKHFGYKAGVKYEYIVPDVYSYSDSVIEFEQHFDAFLSSFLTIRNRLKLTLNLRQSYVTNFSVPFTPALGAEYRIYSGEKDLLKLSSNIARSYRVPTFNDRYWGTQGNPNLKPEDGMNYELGIDYVYCSEDFTSKLSLNAFYMDVENWIEWRNFGVWQAQNVKEVVSKGIEFMSNTDFKLGKLPVNLRLNYNYNPVEAVEDVSETGRVGEQLIYTPKHMGNAFLMTKYQDWQFSIDGVYTGMHFSDDFGNELDPYFIANSSISRKIQISKQLFNISFAINNLLNTDYQNEKYYAMPGRSFRIGLISNLNIK